MRKHQSRSRRTTPPKRTVSKEFRSSVGARVLDDAPTTVQELADRINDGSLVFRSAQAVVVEENGTERRVVRVLFDSPQSTGSFPRCGQVSKQGQTPLCQRCRRRRARYAWGMCQPCFTWECKPGWWRLTHFWQRPSRRSAR